LLTPDLLPTRQTNLQVVEADHTPGPLKIQLRFVAETPQLGDPGKSIGDILFRNTTEKAAIFVSLGQKEKANADTFRKAGGAIGKWLLSSPVSQIDLSIDDSPFADPQAEVPALLEGIRLGSYKFERYKKQDDTQQPVTVFVSGKLAHLQQIVQRVDIITDAVLLSREWAHEPANVINPLSLAERALALAQEAGLKCSIYTEKDLAEMKAGAMLAVGKGSQTPARLIVLEYPGKPGHEESDPIVLVGKALTFDTGGYSLKDTTNIQGMKYDKCGGITVLATMLAAARLGYERPLVGVVGAAENMISQAAYRPDDIIVTMSGKTVEIVSTDAEGRLVLADALTFTQQHYKAKALIDLATLTGGVVVALGRVRAGIMGNNPELIDALISSGERTSERLWQLPLDDEYLQSTKGDDADLKNSGGREGHAILGGIFLKQFVDDSVPWAHLDIAGLADSPKDLPYCPKGATGFGVRLLLDYLANLS
jgi:leucyl aminopeptidase